MLRGGVRGCVTGGERGGREDVEGYERPGVLNGVRGGCA